MRRKSYISRIAATSYQRPRIVKLASELKAERADRDAKGIPHPGPDPTLKREIEGNYDGRGFEIGDV